VSARERAIDALAGRWGNQRTRAEEHICQIEAAGLAIVDAAELARLRACADLARTSMCAWDSLKPEADRVCEETPEAERVADLFDGLLSLAYYALHPTEKPDKEAQARIDAAERAAKERP